MSGIKRKSNEIMIQEQVTGTEHDRSKNCHCCGLTKENILQLISSLVLPLMLGVFTVVITFEQQRIARQQWLADKNESRLQREQELKIAYEQRKQELKIAYEEREAQNQMNLARYRDELLVAYIKEISDMLEKNNGSLTSDPLTHILARARTVNAIEQLDGLRQTRVIRFLYEAKQLNNMDWYDNLDISMAELTNIDFDKLEQILRDKRLSLAGVHLLNCRLPTFLMTTLNFSTAEFHYVNFSSAKLNTVDFSSARFLYVNFSFTHFRIVNFSFAKYNDVDCSSTDLYDIKFSSAEVIIANFSSAILNSVNFSSASVIRVNFSSARLHNVNFAFAWPYDVEFSNAALSNVDFSNAHLSNADFSNARLYNVNFLSANFTYEERSNFYRAEMSSTIFINCDCGPINFSHASLKGSSFRGARLLGADFSGANLQNADFVDAIITDEQLYSALSIHGARLPNGTVGQGQNLIKNGDANCKISLTDHWQVQHGSVMIMALQDNRSDCQFVLQSDTIVDAIMLQRINLINVWDSSMWPNSRVELKAFVSGDVSIELCGITKNRTVIQTETASSTKNHTWMPLRKDIEEIEVMVKFNSSSNQEHQKNTWCDDIKLFIDYDRMTKNS